MALATELVRFFFIDLRDGQHKRSVKSIAEFAAQHPDQLDNLDLASVFQQCSTLEQAGYLISSRSPSNHPVLGRGYYAPEFDESRAGYGEYEFAAKGFLSVRDAFKQSVLPVEVTNANGSPDLGTCFVLGDSSVVATARHVVEEKRAIRIGRTDGAPSHVKSILVSSDQSLDVAFLKLEHPFEGVKPFLMMEPYILDEVMCLGYPPIPGFETILISDVSTLSAELTASVGHVVAAGKSYVDPQQFLLLNARVKGGNSGGPVVNSRGYVVGMLVQAAMSSTEWGSLDQLGYGIVTPMGSWAPLLRSTDPAVVSTLNFANCSDGTFSTN